LSGDQGAGGGVSAPSLTLVAALDREAAIGVANALPWSLPDDLKQFKALTLGKPVLMGRKTAQSLGRALPGRLNLVLTRQANVPFDGMQAVHSIEAALSMIAAPELMVIGGAEVYALTLPLAERMVLTHVYTEVPNADAWFPVWNTGEWHCVAERDHLADARHAFDFCVREYRRVARA
jgi:dihydrofolate reductase